MAKTPDILYTSDLFAPCWSCTKLFPFEELKDLVFDCMGFSVSVCLDCHEAVQWQQEDAP